MLARARARKSIILLCACDRSYFLPKRIAAAFFSVLRDLLIPRSEAWLNNYCRSCDSRRYLLLKMDFLRTFFSDLPNGFAATFFRRIEDIAIGKIDANLATFGTNAALSALLLSRRQRLATPFAPLYRLSSF